MDILATIYESEDLSTEEGIANICKHINSLNVSIWGNLFE